MGLDHQGCDRTGPEEPALPVEAREEQDVESPLLGPALHEQPLLRRTRELLSRYHLRPVKSLGQNFLVDENLARRLVAAALEAEPETVLEIGAGLGALTVPLGQSGVRVVAFEKDPKLAAPLRELCGPLPGVTVYIGDFLSADLTGWLGPRVAAVGNLPFYITSPILERLFTLTPPLQAMVVTVQREAAARLVAHPGTSEYGALTVFCGYYVGSIERVCSLPPGVFLPAPGVWSEALRLVPRLAPPEEASNPDRFFALVRAAFGYRRKTLHRALATANALGLDDRTAVEVIQAAGLDPDRRGETLSLEEFLALEQAAAKWEGTE